MTQTRAQRLRSEEALARAQARKASSATEMFNLLDIASNLAEQAKQAEAEERSKSAGPP